MPSVHLTQTWVTNVATGDSVRAYTAKGRTSLRQREVETRRLAGGRFRAITTLGVRRSQTFGLRDISLAEAQMLEDWIGQLVLIRDNRGRKMFGTYAEVQYVDNMSVNYYDVSLVVTEVTYSESVE
jgi:hypothetical protein